MLRVYGFAVGVLRVARTFGAMHREEVHGDRLTHVEHLSGVQSRRGKAVHLPSSRNYNTHTAHPDASGATLTPRWTIPVSVRIDDFWATSAKYAYSGVNC